MTCPCPKHPFGCYGHPIKCGCMAERVAKDETLELINTLRMDEGNSVTLMCDNPDFNGQPNCAIECCGYWTGWNERRFTGETVLEALRSAAAARREALKS